MEYKSTETYTDAALIDGSVVKGFAAISGNIDTGGDRIFLGAFRKTIKEQVGRVKHLWQHSYDQPPTAVVVEMKEVKRVDLPERLLDKHPEVTGGLLVVREYLDTPRGQEILSGIQAGAITEMSFAYDPVKFDFEEIEEADVKGSTRLVRNLRELRVWDTSDVNWGMNPLTLAVGKSAIPYKDTGSSSEDEAWSAPSLSDFGDATFEDMTDAQKRRVASHYAFSVNNPPESFGDLKLPHHKASSSGIGVAVWRGVAAAMGALMGARGGVSIPDGDKKAVYNHLANHYKEWDKEPPDYKLVELSSLAYSLQLPGALKEGRVLSSRNLEKLREALSVLSEILLAAEPQDDEKALVLTANLLTQLAIAERSILF